MKAIILSAGQGKRLLPLTLETPKAALSVRGRRLLEWQLIEIGKTRIKEVVVITGFGASQIDDIISTHRTTNIKTLFNPFFENCDNLGTCWIAQHEMNEPFVIINGDTLFENSILEQLLSSDIERPITLMCDRKPYYDSDDMKIIENKGRISRVGKDLPKEKVTGESIGMIRFNEEGIELFKDQMNAIMRQNDSLKKWYLSAIDAIAVTGKVGACFIEGYSWCEVDDASDLEIAAKTVQNWNTN